MVVPANATAKFATVIWLERINTPSPASVDTIGTARADTVVAAARRSDRGREREVPSTQSAIRAIPMFHVASSGVPTVKRSPCRAKTVSAAAKISRPAASNSQRLPASGPCDAAIPAIAATTSRSSSG